MLVQFIHDTGVLRTRSGERRSRIKTHSPKSFENLLVTLPNFQTAGADALKFVLHRTVQPRSHMQISDRNIFFDQKAVAEVLKLISWINPCFYGNLCRSKQTNGIKLKNQTALRRDFGNAENLIQLQ